MSKPMTQTDPAYWMLEKGLKDPSKRSSTTVHSDCCYICQDPEFALMGLPLCYPCSECGGHVAADDSRCVNGHQSSHPSEEGIEDMRFTTDHFEFEGPASLLRKDDLFLVSGCMGRCLSFSGEVVEIEWISTPWPVKDGTKERLNVQTQGVLGYSKHRNSVMLVEGVTDTGICFLLGSLVWVVTEEIGVEGASAAHGMGGASPVPWQRCRCLSYTGDLDFAAQEFSLPEQPVVILRREIAECILRSQYQAAHAAFPEALFASLTEVADTASLEKSMAQRPHSSTPLRDVKGFSPKLARVVVTTWNHPTITPESVTLGHFMQLSWDLLFEVPNCAAGKGGNNGKAAVAVLLKDWGVDRAEMGPHFVLDDAPVAPEEQEQEQEQEVEEVQADYSGEVVDEAAYARQQAFQERLDHLMIRHYPALKPLPTERALFSLKNSGIPGVVVGHLCVQDLAGVTWGVLAEHVTDIDKASNTPFVNYLYGALQLEFGEISFPLFPELLTPPEEPEAESSEESERQSTDAFRVCPLNEYFDLSFAASLFQCAVTDFTGDAISEMTSEELSGLFASPEELATFVQWVEENFDLSGSGIPWATVSEKAEHEQHSSAQIAYAAIMSILSELAQEDRDACCVMLDGSVPF